MKQKELGVGYRLLANNEKIRSTDEIAFNNVALNTIAWDDVWKDEVGLTVILATKQREYSQFRRKMHKESPGWRYLDYGEIIPAKAQKRVSRAQAQVDYWAPIIVLSELASAFVNEDFAYRVPIKTKRLMSTQDKIILEKLCGEWISRVKSTRFVRDAEGTRHLTCLGEKEIKSTIVGATMAPGYTTKAPLIVCVDDMSGDDL